MSSNGRSRRPRLQGSEDKNFIEKPGQRPYKRKSRFKKNRKKFTPYKRKIRLFRLESDQLLYKKNNKLELRGRANELEFDYRHFPLSHLYDWQTLNYTNLESKTKDLTKSKNLKTMAVDKIVANIECINHFHLTNLPRWTGFWKLIWEKILLNYNDNFKIFELFANFFGENRDFQCHNFKEDYLIQKKQGVYTSLVRQCAINTLCIKGIKHRLETVPYNIMKQNFIEETIVESTNATSGYFLDPYNYNQRQYKKIVNKFVALNFSNTDNDMLSINLMQKVFNTKNLIAWDLKFIKNSSINNNFIYNMKLSMKNNKLTNLIIFLLGNEKLNPQELIDLIKNSNLIYIETSVDLDNFQDSELKLIKFPLKFCELNFQKKIDQIIKKFEKIDSKLHEIHSKLYLEKDSILMDYQIVNDMIDISKSPSFEKQSYDIWQKRYSPEINVSRHLIKGYGIKRINRKSQIHKKLISSANIKTIPGNKITISSNAFFGLPKSKH